jgi:hypothetical protein
LKIPVHLLFEYKSLSSLSHLKMISLNFYKLSRWRSKKSVSWISNSFEFCYKKGNSISKFLYWMNIEESLKYFFLKIVGSKEGVELSEIKSSFFVDWNYEDSHEVKWRLNNCINVLPSDKIIFFGGKSKVWLFYPVRLNMDSCWSEKHFIYPKLKSIVTRWWQGKFLTKNSNHLNERIFLLNHPIRNNEISKQKIWKI